MLIYKKGKLALFYFICFLIILSIILAVKFCNEFIYISWNYKEYLNKANNKLVPFNQINHLLSHYKSFQLNSSAFSSHVTIRTPIIQLTPLEVEFERRNKHLNSMCKNIHMNSATSVNFGPIKQQKCESIRNKYGFNECLFTDNFQLNRLGSSIVCVLNKVASTSIVTTLLNIHNITVNDMSSPHVNIDRLFPKTKDEFEFARKYFFKYLVVRDPFRRLLSAYRNKVENIHDSETLLDLRYDINKFIVKLNRDRRKSIKENVYFRKYLNLTATNLLSERNLKLTVPSFEEFLEFIMRIKIQGAGFNSHWVPYWKKCAPCSMKYDVIAKLDTDYLELQYIWAANGFPATNVPWKQKSPSDQISLKDTLRRYYSGLSTKIILRVYKMYFPDFKLFNYSIYDILQLGGHCKSEDDCDQIIFDYFHFLP